MRVYRPTQQLIENICGTFDTRTTMALAELEIWQHAGIFGRAHLHFAHFMSGTGERVVFPIALLLREAPGVLGRIQDEIRAGQHQGLTHGHVDVRRVDYRESTQLQRDWYYALGTIRVAWREMAVHMPPPVTRYQRLGERSPRRFHLTVLNEYRWHAKDRMGQPTECVHEAGEFLARTGGARNFMMVGECELQFDPFAPIAIPHSELLCVDVF